jgi:hypothetical protein
VSAPRFGPAACVALAVCLARPAAAWEPEFSVGVEAGGGFVQHDDASIGEGLFLLDLRADVALLRDLSRDVGLGFALDVGSRDFADLPVRGGVEVLLPVHEAFPIVLSGGAGVDALTGDGLWYSRFWWGARSHNQLEPYSTAVGVFVEYVRAISGEASPTLLFGATIDGYVLLWPFMWLYQWAVVDQGPEVV